jgi:hypothetical protein
MCVRVTVTRSSRTLRGTTTDARSHSAMSQRDSGYQRKAFDAYDHLAGSLSACCHTSTVFNRSGSDLPQVRLEHGPMGAMLPWSETSRW